MPGRLSGEEDCRSLPGFAFQTRVLQWTEKMGGIPAMPADNSVKREQRFLQSGWLWDGRGGVNEGRGGVVSGCRVGGAAGPQKTLGSPGAGVLCLGETEAPMSGWLQR